MILVTILLLPLLVLLAQETSSLVVEGQQGQARVIHVQGKNYVDVEGLARVTGGSLRFEENQIILTLPGNGDASSPAVQSSPASPVGYSREFAATGIETMREILEWHAALKYAIERGYPLSDEWLGYFRRQVESSLKHLEAAARSDIDQKTAPLLASEFDRMNALTDKYLKITASRDYLAPSSLSSDPLEQKLLTCWQSLSSMASSNQFVDDGSCQ
jgi:hypothetical protein